MEHYIYVLVALCCCGDVNVYGDAFTSTAALKHLLNSELTLKIAVENYVTAEEERLKELKSYLSTLETHDTPEIDNPVNAYHLVQKWYELSKRATDENNQKAMISSLSDFHLSLPSIADQRGALEALNRLHRVYHLSTADLAAGNIHGYQGAPLTNQELYDLALLAEQSVNYKLAEECLDIILDRNATDIHVSINDVTLELAKIYHLIHDHESAAKTVENIYKSDPLNAEIRTTYHYYKQHNDTLYRQSQGHPAAAPTTQYGAASDPDWLTKYEALCRGDTLYRDPQILKTLVCRYRRTAIPYVTVKEEILSWDPQVMLFHDVISDQQSQYLMNFATPELSRAKVGDPKGDSMSDNRISEVSWVWDTEPLAKRLSDDVSVITGLDTTYKLIKSNAEPFQVVNYGMGGQYEPHVDFYESAELLDRIPGFIHSTGDRISTFMYYLNQPIEGGGTVFPELHIAIPPTKNAAAFWYNMNRAGVYDTRTKHAGCPVLLGEKWVANKWIRELGQAFHRPCGLSLQSLDD